MLKFAVSAVLILGFSVYEGYALQCWACSSDIDRSCGDRFNLTDFRYGAYSQNYGPVYNQQPIYDPYNQRQFDNRDYSTYRTTDTNRDPNRDPNGYRDPNYRGSNRDEVYANDRRRDPYYRDDRDPRVRDQDYLNTNNNRTFDRNRDYDRRGFNGTFDRYNNTDYDNRTNGTLRDPYYNDRDRNSQNQGYNDRVNQNNRDRLGDYNNRDPNNRDSNNRDFNRDNQDRNRDYAGRDPNYRDPYPDRSRDPYYNRDLNSRDPNYRDGNRDPYLDRGNVRDPYNRDPNNRDYPPPPRDYNNQGRAYDPNYPPRDQNYQQIRAQAQLAASQSGPRLVTCNEEEARLRRMRNVCIKKVQRIGDYQLTYIRRCEMIPYEKEIGTCYDAVARGISLDFCEYCEYDGCNSATGLKFNVFLASLVPLALLWAFFS